MSILILKSQRSNCCRFINFIILLLIAAFSLSTGAHAQGSPATVVTLHTFGDGSVLNDGIGPGQIILGSDGNLYGMTLGGGSEHQGVVFKMTPNGTETILHSFKDGSVPNDGWQAEGALVQDTAGNLYGTTSAGGSASDGVIFRITPAGSYTIMHTFGDGSVANDGASPESGLVEGSDGNFYGTALAGGTAGDGVIYRMTPQGVVTILHSFNDGSVQNDGLFEDSPLLLASDGNFYAETKSGGRLGFGTIYRISLSGDYSVLYSFPNGLDVPYPVGPLIQVPDGSLYGATLFASTPGSNGNSIDWPGSIYRFTLSGTKTFQHLFESFLSDGERPLSSPIVGQDGNMYGTTSMGGTTALGLHSVSGGGTIFKMERSGAITILHSFGDGTIVNDGYNPETSPVQAPDGTLYGTTIYSSPPGTSTNFGTMFKVTVNQSPQAPSPTVSPASGVFIGPQSVSISDSLSTAAIYYTIDGSTPTANSTPYIAPFTMSASGNINAIAIEAGDQNSGIKTSSIEINPAQPITFASGLQMISMPYGYPNLSLDNLFGYTGVLVAVWSPTSNEYFLTPNPPSDQISLGQGYWVRFPQPITVDGTKVGMPARSGTGHMFPITLQSGWNMIGDPYNTSIPLSSVFFNSETVSFAQATTGSNPLVGSALWTYSQSTGQYAQATSIDPEHGYWVYAFQSTNIDIPAPN